MENEVNPLLRSGKYRTYTSPYEVLVDSIKTSAYLAFGLVTIPFSSYQIYQRITTMQKRRFFVERVALASFRGYFRIFVPLFLAKYIMNRHRMLRLLNND
ncbi:hypothetical protein RF11_10219 [Thelohanellus kitauei]|uniref:Uncharacterized protein n=1 Tax=Thelohanellus kitauei TaxID=669202 RepID=A0A0C2N6X8_THEKT|nr:hypothetical protein RF11_10219 [Thelohanellus kitauei]